MPAILFLEDQFLCYPLFYAWIFQTVFPFGFPKQNYAFFHFLMHATYLAYLIVCLIPQTIFCEEQIL